MPGRNPDGGVMKKPCGGVWGGICMLELIPNGCGGGGRFGLFGRVGSIGLNVLKFIQVLMKLCFKDILKVKVT
jgi:hypothetical protein